MALNMETLNDNGVMITGGASGWITLYSPKTKGEPFGLSVMCGQHDYTEFSATLDQPAEPKLELQTDDVLAIDALLLILNFVDSYRGTIIAYMTS